MRVRFEFEVDPRESEHIDPLDHYHCESVEDLENELLGIPEPNWRVFVNKNDLAALWEEIARLKATPEKDWD